MGELSLTANGAQGQWLYNLFPVNLNDWSLLLTSLIKCLMRQKKHTSVGLKWKSFKTCSCSCFVQCQPWILLLPEYKEQEYFDYEVLVLSNTVNSLFCVWLRQCITSSPGSAGSPLWCHGSHVQREICRGSESSGAHPWRLLRHLPVFLGVPLHWLLLSWWVHYTTSCLLN